MAVLRTKLICLSVTTGLGGTAALSLKIPGTFSGLDPNSQTPANGRFVRIVRVWSDALLTGDRIYDMRVEDTDMVMVGEGKPFPNAQVAALVFPAYPVLTYFDDNEVVEGNGVLKGVFLQNNQVQEFTPANPGSYDFIPSGCYFKATVKSGDGLPGKTFRANFNLIKQE